MLKYEKNIRIFLAILFISVFTFLNQSFLFNKTNIIEESSNKITSENSKLPSNNVQVIYVDSANVKWIGTDKGLSRFFENEWINYVDSEYFMSNVINDIDCEYANGGKELWIATDSGLTVTAYNIDGITEATTYFPNDPTDNSLLDWKVSHIVVDNSHNRWAVSSNGISIFKGNVWDTIISSADAEGNAFNIADITITDAKFHRSAELVLFSTAEKGILRNSFDEVDGVSGASTYGAPWAAVETGTFYAIDTKDELQWYGSDIGAYEHAEIKTKSDWNLYQTEHGLIDNKVNAIHIDNENNIWMGTSEGLSIRLADNRWFKYTKNEGLINNTINNITSDKTGNVWVSTMGGIEWFSEIPGVEIITEAVDYLKAKNSKLIIYPNPAFSEITIERGRVISMSATLEIYSLTGELLYKIVPIGNKKITINIDDKPKLLSGMYIISLSDSEQKSTTKLLVK